MLAENLQQVEENIQRACDRAGRKKENVTLIAVSKTKPASMLSEIYQCGVRDFGENKVQELCEKKEQLPKDIRWHMIGHLQRNKVKYIIRGVRTHLPPCGRNKYSGEKDQTHCPCSD